MDVGAAVMMVSDRGGVIHLTILLGVNCVIGGDVNMGRMVVIRSFDEGPSRPVGCMAHGVL